MIEKYPELEIFQPTYINGKEEKKDNMYNLFDTFMILKLNVTLEKTLVSVKDGVIWVVRFISM